MKLGGLASVVLVLLAGCTTPSDEPPPAASGPDDESLVRAEPSERPTNANLAPALCPRLDLTPDSPAFPVGTPMRLLARLTACPDRGLLVDGAPCGGHVSVQLPTWNLSLAPSGGVAADDACASTPAPRWIGPGEALEEEFSWNGTIPAEVCVGGSCRVSHTKVVTAWFPVRASARAGDDHAFATIGELQPVRDPREATDEDRPLWSLRWSPATLVAPLGSSAPFEVDVIPRRGAPAPIVVSGLAADFGAHTRIAPEGSRLVAHATMGVRPTAVFAVSSDGALRERVPGPDLVARGVEEPPAAPILPCATLRLVAPSRAALPGETIEFEARLENCGRDAILVERAACGKAIRFGGETEPSADASCQESPERIVIAPGESLTRTLIVRANPFGVDTMRLTARADIERDVALHAVLIVPIVGSRSDVPTGSAEGWSIAFAPATLRGMPGDVVPFSIRVIPPPGTGPATLESAPGLAVPDGAEISARGATVQARAIVRPDATLSIVASVVEPRGTLELPGPRVVVRNGGPWADHVVREDTDASEPAASAVWANGSLVIRMAHREPSLPCTEVEGCRVYVRETTAGIEVALFAHVLTRHASASTPYRSLEIGIDRFPERPAKLTLVFEEYDPLAQRTSWTLTDVAIATDASR